MSTFESELKKLKDDLWHSADMLRAGAHLAANKYGQPILGLIFLRYADILFSKYIAPHYCKRKQRLTQRIHVSERVGKCVHACGIIGSAVDWTAQ